jgi:hypothetical protein
MDWHKYFIYNPDTGDLIWKKKNQGDSGSVNAWNGAWAGKVAGTVSKRRNGFLMRIVVRIEGRGHSAHKIVAEMHGMKIPTGFTIDHIDGNVLNNKVSNLRIASTQENNSNRGLQKNNTIRLKGVRKSNSKYRAQIMVSRTPIHLGTYPTKGLAAVARAKAALRYHGKFARFT